MEGERVKKLANDCWTLGKVPLDGPGYASIYVRGRVVGAHRFSYELHNGPIPKRFLVCHRCDHRGCVNPDHLFIGTQSDNINDCVSKGRHKVFRGGVGRPRLIDDLEVIRLHDKERQTFAAIGRDMGYTTKGIQRAYWRSYA